MFFFSFAQKLAFLLLDRPTGQKSPGNRTENIVKSHYLKFTWLLTSLLGRTLCQPSDQYNNKQMSPLKVTFPPRFLHSLKRELKATFNHHDISSITDCHRTWLLDRYNQMGISTLRWLWLIYLGVTGCTSKDLLNPTLLHKPIPKLFHMNGLTVWYLMLWIKPHSMLFQGTKIFPPHPPPFLKLQAKTDQPQKGPNEITLNFLFLKSGLILWQIWSN